MDEPRSPDPRAVARVGIGIALGTISILLTGRLLDLGWVETAAVLIGGILVVLGIARVLRERSDRRERDAGPTDEGPDRREP